MKAEIYTDGCCIVKHRVGGWGCVVFINNECYEMHGGQKDTTNNRMELSAIINGCKDVIDRGADEINIFSDSQYCCNIINGWMYGWKRNNFMKNETEKVLNSDLVIELLDVSSKVKLKAEWVRGHNGHPLNERADALSRIWPEENGFPCFNKGGK